MAQNHSKAKTRRAREQKGTRNGGSDAAHARTQNVRRMRKAAEAESNRLRKEAEARR